MDTILNLTYPHNDTTPQQGSVVQPRHGRSENAHNPWQQHVGTKHQLATQTFCQVAPRQLCEHIAIEKRSQQQINLV